MSRSTRSGLTRATASRASVPEAADTTEYPREVSTASSNRTFCGMSSTTRMVAAGSTVLLGSAGLTVAPDLVRERFHMDRLLEIAVEPGGKKRLAVALHCVGGQGHDGKRRRARVRAEA